MNSNNQSTKTFEVMYEQTKYQIINSVNQIASQNGIPSFLIAILLKEISIETTNTSLGSMVAQNEMISKEDYAEYLKFKSNQQTE